MCSYPHRLAWQQPLIFDPDTNFFVNLEKEKKTQSPTKDWIMHTPRGSVVVILAKVFRELDQGKDDWPIRKAANANHAYAKDEYWKLV